MIKQERHLADTAEVNGRKQLELNNSSAETPEQAGERIAITAQQQTEAFLVSLEEDITLIKGKGPIKPAEEADLVELGAEARGAKEAFFLKIGYVPKSETAINFQEKKEGEDVVFRQQCVEAGRKKLLHEKAGGLMGTESYQWLEKLLLKSGTIEGGDAEWKKTIDLTAEDLDRLSFSVGKGDILPNKKELKEISLPAETEIMVAEFEKRSKFFEDQYAGKDITLFPAMAKKKILTEQQELENLKNKLVDQIALEIRLRMPSAGSLSTDALSRLLKPEDAEVLLLTKDELRTKSLKNQEVISNSKQANARRAEFIEGVLEIMHIDNKLTSELSNEIYDRLLLEEVNPDVRNEFLRTKNARQKIYDKHRTDRPYVRELPGVAYEYFDPEEQVSKIRSGRGLEDTPLWRKSLDQQERLAEYKNLQIEQKKGMMELSGKMEKIMLDGGVFNAERRAELWKLIQTEAPVLKLSPIQLARYEKFLDELTAWNAKMDEAQGELTPGEDDAKLFERLFGFQPQGESFIKRGPVSFFVDCRSYADYKRARGEDADLTLGFARGFVTIIKNAEGKKSEKVVEETRLHEEAHVLKFVLDKFLVKYGLKKIKPSSFQPTKDVEDDKTKKAQKAGEIADSRAKGEIFAFLKDGTTIAMMRHYLLKEKTQEGLYDYLAPQKEETSEEFSTAQRLERERHRQTLQEALDIIETLQQLGLSEKQVRKMFETVPLKRWKKESSRMEDEGTFVSIRQDTIYKYQEEIANLKQQLAKNAFSFSIAKYLDMLGLANFMPKSIKNASQKNIKIEEKIKLTESALNHVSKSF